MLLLLIDKINVLSCLNESDGDTFGLNILKCINEDGKMIDIKTITNMSPYKLYFRGSSAYFELGIYLFKEYTPHGLYVQPQSVKFIRCTETISNGNLDEGIVITKPKHSTGIYCLDKTQKFIDTGSSLLYLYLFIGFLNRPEIYCCSDPDNKNHEICTNGYCTKRITFQFRKELGILGKGIETAAFKFRFELKIQKNYGQYFGTITAETKPFSFIEKDDGTLVLKEIVKHEYCLRSSNIKQ
ncbi:hypothetical protein CDIK_2009 [Cucumispora dikerogammari]|nr:hypothetical protein CDIK_2009 [Cucumispora dikerogammari]